MNIKEYLMKKNLLEIRKDIHHRLINIMNEKKKKINRESECSFSYDHYGLFALDIDNFITNVSEPLEEIKTLNQILDSIFRAKTIEELEKIDLKNYLEER